MLQISLLHNYPCVGYQLKSYKAGKSYQNSLISIIYYLIAHLLWCQSINVIVNKQMVSTSQQFVKSLLYDEENPVPVVEVVF